MELEDIICYESEKTSVDFKQKQYSRSSHVDLLKDIMAMANADVTEERYIITGVDYHSSKKRKILGIPESEFADDADYQQLVKKNIEPDIRFSYSSFLIDGKLVGIFKIGPCLDPPYLMKKDYTPLFQGDGYIRKGTSQVKLARADYDRIYQAKQRRDLGRKIKIGIGDELVSNLTTPDCTIEFPSYRALGKIVGILEGRKLGVDSRIRVPAVKNYGLDGTPYEWRSNDDLESILVNLADIYAEDDSYFIQEEAFCLNIGVQNEEDEYIKNATFILEIPKVIGINVLDRLEHKPLRSLSMHVEAMKRGFSHPHSSRYPHVEDADTKYLVRQPVGDIINHLHRDLFPVPLRIIVEPDAAGKTISLDYKLFGENLHRPIEGRINLTFGHVYWLKAPKEDEITE